MDKTIIRPIIEGLQVDETTSQAERFQQLTLRPIIKLQHELLIAFFINHIASNKITFESLTPIEKRQVITKTVKKDQRLKIELRGLIIGLFTITEYRNYQEISVELNKRILSIIQERLLSTLC